MENKRMHIYYNDIDINKKKAFKNRYLIYGISILISAIILLILESTKGYGVSKILDNIVSFSMFLDMAIGILFIIRAFTLKDRIRADSLIINMENYILKKENNEYNIKRTFSLLRFFLILSIFFNISIITMYFIVIFSYKIEAHLLFSFIFAIILFLLPIISFISLDYESYLYKKIEK